MRKVVTIKINNEDSEEDLYEKIEKLLSLAGYNFNEISLNVSGKNETIQSKGVGQTINERKL